MHAKVTPTAPVVAIANVRPTTVSSRAASDVTVGPTCTITSMSAESTLDATDVPNYSASDPVSFIALTYRAIHLPTRCASVFLNISFSNTIHTQFTVCDHNINQH